MIRRMRRVWAFVLCLGLLWSGGVAPVLASMPCGMAMADTAGDAAPSALPDCCLDADTAAWTGQTCQPGQACAVVGLALPLAATAWAPARASVAAPAPRPDAMARAAPPGSVWRPPTARG
jgi:hypothetical protein